MKFRKPLELIYPIDGINEYYSIYVFQNGVGTYKFKTIKAVTIAVMEVGDRNINIFPPAGISICSGMDEFDVNIGITKAMGRALSKDAYVIFPFGEFELNLAEVTRLAIKTAKRIDKRNMRKWLKREHSSVRVDNPYECWGAIDIGDSSEPF